MPMSTTVGYLFGSGTISSTALALTDAPFNFSQVNVNLADRMRVTAATNDLRFCYDGTTPTAAIGHLLAVGQTLILDGQNNISAFKVIRATGADGAASITLEHY